MNKLTGLLAAFAFGGLMLSAQPASALSCSATGSGGHTVSFTLDVAADAKCATDTPGHGIDHSSGAILSEFGANFFEGDKIEQSTGAHDSGDGNVTLSFANGTPNTWSISTAITNIINFVIEIKQDGALALFLIDKNVLSGTWSTSGPSGSVNGWSHASVWYRTDGPPDFNNPVPLPAAGFLLLGALGALGGLGAWRRRQMAA